MNTTADPEYLALRETHCAGILLVGNRAYKFKKPVDFGFLDFSTAEKRAHACQQRWSSTVASPPTSTWV